MTQKHTPGPWKIFRAADGFKILGIGDKNAEGITDGHFNLWRGHDEEAEANARLIAAAPELLDALKCIVEQSQKLQRQGIVRSREADKRWRQAVAVIAKAEGRG